MRAIQLGTPEKVGGKVRWRRMVKGKRWQSSVYPEDSRRNRSEAWNEFLIWEQAIEAEAKSQKSTKRKALEEKIETIENNAEYWRLLNQKSLTKGFRSIASKLRRAMEADEEKFSELIGNELIKELTDDGNVVKNAAWIQLSRETKSTDLEAGKVAESYLKIHNLRAKAGEITAGRYGKIRNGVNKFIAWFGKKTSMGTLSETTVSEYYQHQIELKNNGANSNTIADDFGMFRQFIDEVSDDTPEIPKPKNLRSRKFTIGRTRSEPNPFTPNEFRLIYENSSDRTKLYLLLMLNCSFYQGDLAEITAEEVDWEQGRICRARSKKKKLLAKKNNHDPIKINYKLWNATFRLLEAHGHREGLVLRNQNGGPIVVSAIKGDKEYRNDNVASAYKRVIQKMKNQKILPDSFKKSLKQLRKTGPDMLDQHSEKYSEFIDVMLDHTRVANRSYLKSGKPHKPFDEALEFVGKQFGF